MATLKTTIMINDMMSQQFRTMNMAMTTVIDSFQTLQDTSSRAIDVSALESAQRELQQVESNFNQIEQEIKQAERAQESFNREMHQADNLAKKLLGTLGAIVGTYLTVQGVKDTIALSDEVTNTVARLDLMNDGLQTTVELQQMIFDSAQRSYGSYMDMADLVGKLALNAGDAFSSNKEAIAFAELLNKQFTIAGTGANEMRNATIQLVQALGSGVLRGDELNSIFEQAPTIIQSIADYLDVPIGQIREMAANGEITAQIVKASMFAAADDINEKFASMPLTFGQIWTTFQNDALRAFEPVLQKLNDIANSEKFQSFVNDAKRHLYSLAQITLYVLDGIAAVGGFIYDNWNVLGPVIMSVAGSILAVSVALGVVTAATWLWNAALAANPIVWIIIATIIWIAALITIFYTLIDVINQFTGATLNATGLIIGAFALMGAFIANVFLGLLQIVLAIIEVQYNQWIAFANFFGNVFNDPVGAIIRLFGDLGDNVLNVIEKIARAIDYVFGSNLASAVAGWRSELAGLVNWAAEEYGNGQYEVLYEELDVDKVISELGLNLDRFSYGDAWSSGYDWGANLFSSFDLGNFNQNDPNKLLQDALAGLDDIQGAIEAGNGAGKDTAGNTKKLADSVDLLEDDIKYLRDLAERETINRYVTGEIFVDARSENHINNEMDIDGIIDRFAEKLEEAVEVVAEGDDFNV